MDIVYDAKRQTKTEQTERKLNTTTNTDTLVSLLFKNAVIHLFFIRIIVCGFFFCLFV